MARHESAVQTPDQRSLSIAAFVRLLRDGEPGYPQPVFGASEVVQLAHSAARSIVAVERGGVWRRFPSAPRQMPAFLSGRPRTFWPALVAGEHTVGISFGTGGLLRQDRHFIGADTDRPQVTHSPPDDNLPRRP